jgi:hypothetical protein
MILLNNTFLKSRLSCVIILLASIMIIGSIILYNQLSKTKGNYIICQHTKVTGFDWVMIGDKNGLFEAGEGEYIGVIGNTPVFYSPDYDIWYWYSGNKYIFYGAFGGTNVFDGENYRVFNLSHWEALSPIERLAFRNK